MLTRVVHSFRMKRSSMVAISVFSHLSWLSVYEIVQPKSFQSCEAEIKTS